jgi:glycine/D-amino acid oxidase-like deaminating enzyme
MPNKAGVTIVGGGLAGTVLALTCFEKQLRFKLVDKPAANSSSRVAAGMWNPVTFKKCNLSWQAVAQIEKLHEFYSAWEKKLKVSFFHPMRSEKLVPNAEYYNNWSARSSAAPYNRFLGNIHSADRNQYPILKGADSATLAQVMQAGYLDVPVFIDAAHDFLRKEGLYEEEQYNSTEALKTKNKVIFAEGFALKSNDFFNYLPLNGTHGDILTIKADIKSNSIFNFGKFLLPLKDGIFRYGSTYNWTLKTSDVSEEGKQELVEHWAKHFDASFDIIEQKAGIRPTVKDRIPLVGKHPEHHHLYCFNGLGTKGVMIAPWLADNFVQSLMGLAELNKEVNIDRFEALWKK